MPNPLGRSIVLLLRPSIEVGGNEDLIRPEPGDERHFKRLLEREKAMRVSMPHQYEGKSLDEWHTFIQKWEAIFRSQLWTYNSHVQRINAAATTLNGDPYHRWEVNMRSPIPMGHTNWEQFKEFLRSMVKGAKTREKDAFKLLGRLRL